MDISGQDRRQLWMHVGTLPPPNIQWDGLHNMWHITDGWSFKFVTNMYEAGRVTEADYRKFILDETGRFLPKIWPALGEQLKLDLFPKTDPGIQLKMNLDESDSILR